MTGGSYHFGEFELDRERFELRRNGRSLKLERIPLELLLLLAERQGAVVTRQEIIDRLWGKDVFVDTEHGINTAIRKIRQTLKDDPEQPRFVQTVTGKGYRFVAEINRQPLPSPESQPAATPSPEATPAQGLPTRPPATHRNLIFAAVALFLIAAILSFAFRNRLFPSSRAAQIHSIAVIPLANLSGDASQDYYADGMTDELITALAKNHNLRVTSRTSAMQYKGVKRPLPEIAKELNVDGILEGSIERTPDKVHMTAQLIYAPTDSHVWAESYDRDVNQAYSLPEELSQTIAKEVKTATSPAPPARYINPEAHDAYLHGRYFWFSTLNPKLTLPYFEKAIQLQPDYAAAWSGLADTYALEGMETRSPLEVSEKMHAAALKALELDPLLAEAHNSLSAWYLFYAWDPAHAEAEDRRAIELNPNMAEAHHLLSYILEAQLRYAEGEVEAKRAVELDPYVHPWELGAYYMGEHKFDDAINEFKLQAAAHPGESGIIYQLSTAYWHKSMYKESQEQLEHALDLDHDSKRKAIVHEVWMSGGELAVEREGAANIKILASKQYFETEFVATIIAYTGDKDETLKYLELSYRNHDPDLIFIQNESLFDFLHSDPRYQALVKKIGLQLAP